MPLLLMLVLPLGFAGIWRLQHGIDSQLASVSQERDDVLLRSGKLVKMMSLEYAPLMADITVWILAGYVTASFRWPRMSP